MSTNQTDFQKLVEIGWSQEGAKFLLDREDDPRLARFFRKVLQRKIPYKRRKQYKKTHIPNWLRKQVFERDAYRCQHCGDWHDLTIDHIKPESMGGPTELSNLQTLCRRCNSRKGTKFDINGDLQ